MNSRVREAVYAGVAVLLGGAFLALPACSDDGSVGPDLRDARAVVHGTVTNDGEPAAGVEVTVTPFDAVCQEMLLGGAAPTVETDPQGSYSVSIEREILGSSVEVCPEVDFVPPAGSGMVERTIEGDPQSLVELRAVDAGDGVDSLAVDVDLAPDPSS